MRQIQPIPCESSSPGTKKLFSELQYFQRSKALEKGSRLNGSQRDVAHTKLPYLEITEGSDPLFWGRPGQESIIGLFKTLTEGKGLFSFLKLFVQGTSGRRGIQLGVALEKQGSQCKKRRKINLDSSPDGRYWRHN